MPGPPGGSSTLLLIPAVGRQGQEDVCEFEANLVYKASFRTATDIRRNLVSKTIATIRNKQAKRMLGSGVNAHPFPKTYKV